MEEKTPTPQVFGGPDNEKKVKVELFASPNAMEHWALQYVSHVEVIRPLSLRERIRTVLHQAIDVYADPN